MKDECIYNCGNVAAVESIYCVSCRNVRTMRGFVND